MAVAAVVAAVGHAWLRDQAFGLKVLGELRARGVPAGVELADWSFGTITAFQRLAERSYQVAVFVGSASRGRRAGVLYKHRAEDPLPSPEEIHARIADCAMGLVSLDNLLVIARYYDALPRRVAVLETEPVDDTWGDELSPGVAALVPVAVDDILEEIEAA